MNIRSKVWHALSFVLIAGMALAACTTPTPEVVTEREIVTQIVTEVVTQEVEVEVEREVIVTPTPVPTTRTGAWLDEVVFSVVDADAVVTQLQAAAIDIYASALSSADKAAIEEAGLNYGLSNGLYYELTFNPVGPTFEGTGKLNPFSSQAIRHAMNWLIDRDYINQEVYAGGALPKYTSMVTQFPTYTEFVDTVRAIEAELAYNPEMAEEVITAEMEALGATMENGLWMYEGEPVTIIFLIRNDSDGTRVPIGDYVANQLESIGFTVDRQYKRSSEASPLWVSGNPNDGLWHIYTGAWSATIIDRDEGDNFQFFDSPNSAYGFSPLWQAFDAAITPEYKQIADDLAYNTFTSLEERAETMRQALQMAADLAIHVWLIDGKGYSPYNQNVEVGYDLAAGIDGAQIWPYTLRFADREGGRMAWGQPDLFVDPWNPLAGSNWAFDQSAIRATQTGGVMYDPYTGLVWPHRLETATVTARQGLPIGQTLDWVTLEFEPEIVVPDDALVDWDAENQVFLTAAEAFTETQTADLKVEVVYPSDMYDTVKWHDGSNISAADFLIYMIMQFDPGTEGSAIFDESQVGSVEAFKSQFKGFKITSTDPLTIEFYQLGFQLDAELNVAANTGFPQYNYGEMGWHQIAIANRADAAGELAYSADKADASEIEWLSFIGGPSMEILKAQLDSATAEGYIPYEPTLSQYLTPEEVASRYENLANWYTDQGHLWLGTGPYYVDRVFLTEKTLTLHRFADYPDLANRWSTFGTPKLVEAELDGPGQVTIGEEATFDVFVTFGGEPYPQAEIKDVKYLVFDANREVVATGSAEAVADGQYQIVLSADITNQLEAGANLLEVAAVSYVVAQPAFTNLEFVSAP